MQGIDPEEFLSIKQHTDKHGMLVTHYGTYRNGLRNGLSIEEDPMRNPALRPGGTGAMG